MLLQSLDFADVELPISVTFGAVMILQSLDFADAKLSISVTFGAVMLLQSLDFADAKLSISVTFGAVAHTFGSCGGRYLGHERGPPLLRTLIG
jgi:hypothetical protein